MIYFDQQKFISKHITLRNSSLFAPDIETNKDTLKKNIEGKSVLVIGGAGTIGSSFIKALLPFKPKKLIVVDYSENGLTELTRDLRSSFNDHIPDEYVTYPFDFGGPIFKKLLANSTFDIIACFAAHKHVRSEKDHLAIEAMFTNNVVNTYHLLEQLKINKPKHFFSVSTDKAANPVNVMGATKKIMEKVLLAYSQDFKITTARFANVAFSNGSLLFGFNERIAKRQPLSSPLDVKRYFVSPEESGQLCLLACIIGESSDIFFPKLNEDNMLTFSSIAENYLKTIGLEPSYSNSEEEARVKAAEWNSKQKEYPVYFFSSDTSGEKQFEEFYNEKDQLKLDDFYALGIVKSSHIPSHENISRLINTFVNSFDSEHLSKSQIISLLNEFLPDFNHIETGKNLDQKM